VPERASVRQAEGLTGRHQVLAWQPDPVRRAGVRLPVRVTELSLPRTVSRDCAGCL